MQSPARIQAAGWSRTAVGEARAALTAELAEVAAASGDMAAFELLRELIARLAESPSPGAAPRRFVAVLALLEHHERAGGLTTPQINQLEGTARALLKTTGIAERGSRLSFLHDELQLVLAAIKAKEGRHLESAFLIEQVKGRGQLDQPESGQRLELMRGERAARLGNLGLAFEALATADGDQAAFLRAHLLRLSGRLDAAAAAAEALGEANAPSAELGLALEWEALCRHAQATGDPTVLIAATARGRAFRQARHVLEASLWAKASANARHLALVPRMESVRRSCSEPLGRGTRYGGVYDCIVLLERAYDGAIPIDLRLAGLRDVLMAAPSLPTLETELLCLVAVARWCARNRQPGLARLAAEAYRGWSLKLSDGAQRDVLGLAAGLDQEQPRASKEPTPSSAIPTGTLARAASVTAAAAGVAGVRLLGSLRRAKTKPSEREALRGRDEQRIAAILQKRLGAMRGPVAKIAQVAAYLTPKLTAPVRDALASLQDAGSPISGDEVRRIVEAAHGRPLSDVFAEFPLEPMATGSIGQAHHARLRDGTEVVVKVQYPGMPAAIRADVKMIDWLRPLYQRFFPSIDFPALLRFVESALLEECDYLREAELQERVGRHFAGDQDLFVPRLHRELCTREVLVMDFVHGQSLAQFIVDAGDAERARAARAILRFAHESVLGPRVLSGDPNPGNFLFTADGRVACLDFGFATEMTAERAELWRQLWLSTCHHDAEAYGRAVRKLGYVADERAFDFEGAWRSLRESTAPLFDGNGPTRVTHDNLWRNVQGTATAHPSRRHLRLPVEDLHLQRSMLYYLWMLAELDVAVDWRAVVLAAAGAGPAAQNVG